MQSREFPRGIASDERVSRISELNMIVESSKLKEETRVDGSNLEAIHSATRKNTNFEHRHFVRKKVIFERNEFLHEEMSDGL